MLFHRTRQNALLPSIVPTSHFLTNWLWGFYDWCTYRKNHFCQASSVTCPWDMTSPLPRIALSNQIFPGQCKLWQIPSSCIMRFPANLPNSREGLMVSAEGHVVWLNDAETTTLNRRYFSLPSCDHLVSSVFSYFDSVCWSGEYRSTNNLAEKQLCQGRTLLENCHKWSKRMCLKQTYVFGWLFAFAICRLGPWCETSHLHEQKQT